MKLTTRDYLFLSDLSTIKYLNSLRIARLFGNYKTTMRRLKILTENNLIQNQNCAQTKENIYTITKKGCKLINSSYSKSQQTDKIFHYLACADFYFYLKSHFCIDNFLIEQQIKFKHLGQRHSFRPDIICSIDKRLFLCEVDLTNKRFEEKIKRWEMYYLSNEFIKQFDKFPPIIIVSTDVEKIQNIVSKNKTINLNYSFKSYEEVSNWQYRYMFSAPKIPADVHI
jgi:predicted transcriptional regulator